MFCAFGVLTRNNPSIFSLEIWNLKCKEHRRIHLTSAQEFVYCEDWARIEIGQLIPWSIGRRTDISFVKLTGLPLRRSQPRD